MMLTPKRINELCQTYGASFYILDTEKFRRNFKELLEEFRAYYPKTFIAYSYKTNYIPRLCKIVKEMGGYAEVVSDMESDIALRLGVTPDKITFNGPYKQKEAVERLLLAGATINVDSTYDFQMVQKIAQNNPDKLIGIGIRCNFDIGDGIISRFGFDVESPGFKKVLEQIKAEKNLYLKGFHCHFAARNIDLWEQRVERMLEVVRRNYEGIPEFICLGGGIFGKMEESLKKQFSTYIPNYKEYAETIAKRFALDFQDYPEEKKPKLVIEPGSALAGDAMRFVSQIVNIKQVRGKAIATLLGSVYNINPTLNGKNPPIEIIHTSDLEQQEYEDMDFGGYTCIESDYLYKGFHGKCAEGDHVIFHNVGSYSIVMKPPFILPNFPVLELDESSNEVYLIKAKEEFEDLFRTYSF